MTTWKNDCCLGVIEFPPWIVDGAAKTTDLFVLQEGRRVDDGERKDEAHHLHFADTFGVVIENLDALRPRLCHLIRVHKTDVFVSCG